MDDKMQIIKLVKDFLFYSRELLNENKIDYEVYVKITEKKIEFLKRVEGNFNPLELDN